MLVREKEVANGTTACLWFEVNVILTKPFLWQLTGL